MDRIIWVLGSRHENADLSIRWDDPFPNFSNCDLLIVNLQTLNRDLLLKHGNKILNEGRRYIFDLLMTGNKDAIFVLNADLSYLDWLPAYPVLKRIASANIGEYRVDSFLEDYMKNVENCPFYITRFGTDFLDSMTDPKSSSHESYPFTSRISSSDFQMTSPILNQARQRIGGCYSYVLLEEASSPVSALLGEQTYTPIHATGRMIFLPPPTTVSAEEAIDLIINNLLGRELKETPPQWIKEVDLPGLSEITDEIAQQEDEKKRISARIENLVEEKNRKTLFRRLLWTKGTALEEVVREAFVFLGFPEIRKVRSKELEDWLFEFEANSDYQYAVLEIKGADKRTALSDLTQCNKWVEDYLLDGKKAKGIFLPNQYRLENIEASKESREHFEPNELDYAKSRDICILPTYEIFNAVVKKMEDSSDITREDIERKICAAKGLCRLL